MPRIRRSAAELHFPGEWWYSEATLRRLGGPAGRRVTVVRAPAGSGKSYLVRRWLSENPQIGCIWMDFGPADGGCAPSAALAAELVRDVVGEPGADPAGTCLVLRRLELLAADVAADLIDRLLAETSARLVLIGAGAVLPAGCAVRCAGDLQEVGPEDLWWPRRVLADRLEALLGSRPTEAECDRLARLTGGWPAGLLILGRAMQAMQGSQAMQGRQGRQGMRALPQQPIADVELNHPEILDFVEAEVLRALPADLGDFVRRTSVLAELDPATCAVLAPAAVPEGVFARLRRFGLLEAHSFGPGEGLGTGEAALPEPARMRYPPLVRAAAVRALALARPGAPAELVRLAADHAHRLGEQELALARYLAADRGQEALAVLESAAADGFAGWEPLALQAGVRGLPSRLWAEEPPARALLAFAAAMSGDCLLAADLVHRAPVELGRRAPWWPAVCGIVLALGVNSSGHRGAALAQARFALARIAELDAGLDLPAFLGLGELGSLAALAHLLAARAALLDGDLTATRAHLDSAGAVAEERSPRWCLLLRLGVEALVSVRCGALSAAQRCVGRAQRLAEQAGLSAHPMFSLALLARVELLRQRGRTGEARAELEAAGAVIRRGEPFVAAARGGQLHTCAGQLLRALLALDAGDPDTGRIELELLEADGGQELPDGLLTWTAIAWARVHLLQDDLAAAEAALARAPEPLAGAVRGLRIALALRQEALAEARQELQDWPEEPGEAGVPRLLASAALAQAGGREQQAENCTAAALLAAEPDAQVQVFLDSPADQRSLTLAVLDRERLHSPWRVELRRRLQGTLAVAGPAPSAITRRERVVLEYLSGHLTHAQIAGALFVSENTLKSHCRNLYRKLGVNTQADAVRVARARGWLGPADVVLDLQAAGLGAEPARRDG